MDKKEALSKDDRQTTPPKRGKKSMKARKIEDDIYWMGAIDREARLFDSLIPLPDGTRYNAYLISGSEKTMLIDTVEPTMINKLMSQLESVEKIDSIASFNF